MTDAWNHPAPDNTEATEDETVAYPSGGEAEQQEGAPDPGSAPEDEETAAEAREPSAVDRAIDAKLNDVEIGRMVDEATGDLIKKTLEKAARSAVARSLTADQIEKIYTAAESVVADRFPQPAGNEGDPAQPSAANPATGEMPSGQISDREYTRRFLNWCDEFLPTVESTLGQNQPFLWCKSWYDHPEAVARLVALWQAWEGAISSKDRRSISSWWTDHWDRHLNTLLSGRGPFRTCELKHVSAPSIPYSRAPREFVVPAPPPPAAD